MGLPARYVAQISVAFTARQREWLDRKQLEDEMSFGEIVRGLVEEAMLEDEQAGLASTKRRPRPRRTKAAS